jgi:lipopolysaccharide transport system ATP-binding protein
MQVLKVTDLGKYYNMNDTKLSSIFHLLFRKSRSIDSSNWVLRNVSFSANSNEVIGIIGINGAGKSTLLSMISGSLKPSEGKVFIKGKVSSILELGIGFDSNFTGKENIKLNAQINGVTQSKLNKLLPQIEEFADIGIYLDKKISTYSTGMLARLAFAIATAEKPDILIVDEAISVGDLAFQAKCMQRIRDLREQGTCILLVTHALNLVREFCDKAIYLAEGSIKLFGNVDYTCDHFQNDMIDNKIHHRNESRVLNKVVEEHKVNPNVRKSSSVTKQCGTLQLEFIDFKVMNSKFDTISTIDYDEIINFTAFIKANVNVTKETAIGLLVADKYGYHLFCCNSNHYGKFIPSILKDEVMKINWQFKWPFRQGEFRIDIGMKPDPMGNIFYDRIFTACTLTTPLKGKLINENFGGYLYIDADIKISPIN